MMNAAKPMLTITGGNHHASVRSLRCGISARVGERGHFGSHQVLHYWVLFSKLAPRSARQLRRCWPSASVVGGFVGHNRDGDQLFAVSAEGVAHLSHSPSGVVVGQNVYDEPQCPQKAFVGDQASGL